MFSVKWCGSHQWALTWISVQSSCIWWWCCNVATMLTAPEKCNIYLKLCSECSPVNCSTMKVWFSGNFLVYQSLISEIIWDSESKDEVHCETTIVFVSGSVLRIIDYWCVLKIFVMFRRGFVQGCWWTWSLPVAPNGLQGGTRQPVRVWWHGRENIIQLSRFWKFVGWCQNFIWQSKNSSFFTRLSKSTI